MALRKCLNVCFLKTSLALSLLILLFLGTAAAEAADATSKNPVKSNSPLYVKPYSFQVLGSSGKTVKAKDRVSILVRVKDAQKKPVSNLLLRFALELAPMEAAGTELSSSEALTDAKGEAKVVFSVGDRDGTYRVSLSSEEAGLSSFFSVKAQTSFKNSKLSGSSVNNFMFPADDVSSIPALPALPLQDSGETVVEVKQKPAKKNNVLPAPPKDKDKNKERAKKNKKTDMQLSSEKKKGTVVAMNVAVKENVAPKNVQNPILEMKTVIKENSDKETTVADVKMQPVKKDNKDKDALLAEARVKLKLKTTAAEAKKIVVKPEAVKLPADGKSETKITVSVMDAYGNPVADGTKVTVQSSRGKIILQDEDTDTQGLQVSVKNGKVQFILKSPEESGTCYVQAKVKDVKGEAKLHFYGTLSYITVSPLSPSIACGNTMKFQASGYDKSNEPVTISPGYAVDGNIGKIDSKTGKFVAAKAGRGKILAVAGSFKGFTEIEIVPGKPEKIVASIEPKSPVAGKNVTLVAKLFDAFGNKIPDADVKFTLAEGSGVFSAQKAKTSAGGMAMTTLTVNKKVSAYKIVASHGALEKTVAFKSVPAELVSLKVLPKDIELHAGIPLTFKTQGMDNFGNVVSIHPKFYALGIGKVDQEKGVFVSRKTGTGKVLVSVKKLSETSNITVLPSKPVRIDVRSAQKQVTVGGETQVMATVYDSFGNPVPNVKLYFNVLSQGTKISAIEHVTDLNGKAEATLKVPTKVSDVVIEVVSPEVNSWLPYGHKTDAVVAQSGLFDVFPLGFSKKVLLASTSGASLKIKIVSGMPKKMVLKAYPAKIVADGQSTSIISVEVLDEFGNFVEKEFPVTFKTSGGNISTPDQDKTMPGTQVILKGGKAQITVVSGKKLTDAIVSAEAQGFHEKVMISFVSSSPSTMKIIPDPQQLTGDGKSLSKVMVKVVDKYGNGITDKNVKVSVDKGELRMQPDSTASYKSVSVPLVSGDAICYFLPPKGTGTATLKAELGSMKTQANIIIVSAALQSLQVTPGSTQIKAGETVILKVKAQDSFGNVLFVSPLWGVVGDGAVDETGRFTSTKTGKATVIARAGEIVGQSSVTILPAEPAKLKVNSQLSEATVGKTVEIVSFLYDKFGNGVSGETLSYQLVSQEGTLSSQESVTDKVGKTSVSLTLSPHTGLNIVKVKHKNKNVRAVQVFVKGLPSPAASLSLRSSPAFLLPSGYCLISAQVMDAYGNLVDDGTSVTFTATAGSFSTGSMQLTVPVVGGIASAKLLFDENQNEIVVTALAEDAPPSQLTLKKSTEPVVSIVPKEGKKSVFNNNIPNIPQLPPDVFVAKGKGLHVVQSIQCSGCDIRWLLTELSKRSGVNIVADGSVKGETTIVLQNTPVEEALAVIVRATGFTYEKIGESYLVSTLEKLKTLPQTEIIPLQQAQAKDVESLLKDIVKEGSILVDKRTNSIVVTAPRNQLIEVKRLVSELDGPISDSAGILIKVIRLEYADPDLIRTVLQQMKIGTEEGTGLEIYNPFSGGSSGGGGTGGTGTGTTGTAGGQTAPSATTGTGTGGATGGAASGGVTSGSVTSSAVGNILILKETPYNIARAESIIKNIDVRPQQVMIETRIEEVKVDALKNIGFQWPEQLGTTFTEKKQDLKSFSRSSIAISAALKALESSGDAKTLSSPSIATVDGKAAFIHIGDNIFYKQPSVVVAPGATGVSSVVQTFEWKSVPVGIILNITPRVSEDGYISTSINNTVSTADIVAPEAPPNVKQRTAQTFVRVQDGGTIVIGGLISNDEIDRLSEVPFISNLPIVGSFFKNHSKEKRRSELFIFLTPHIIK